MTEKVTPPKATPPVSEDTIPENEVLVDAKFPFSINDVEIVKFTAVDINFDQFCEIVETAVNDTSSTTIDVLMLRGRFEKQIQAHGKDSKVHSLDSLSLMKLPSVYAIKLRTLLNDQSSAVGKILSKGDGITTPIHYELGTPLKLAGDKEIKELEFISKLYGDIETVIVEPQALLQARELIKHCCLPVSDSDMIAMPDMLYKQISVTDGIMISTLVVPSFLE